MVNPEKQPAIPFHLNAGQLMRTLLPLSYAFMSLLYVFFLFAFLHPTMLLTLPPATWFTFVLAKMLANYLEEYWPW